MRVYCFFKNQHFYRLFPVYATKHTAEGVTTAEHGYTRSVYYHDLS